MRIELKGSAVSVALICASACAQTLPSLRAPGAHGIVLTVSRPAAPPSLNLLSFDGRLTPLAPSLHASSDPDISFDGTRLLFSAQPAPNAAWQIFELTLPSGPPRQITHCPTDCRQPVYQSPIFSLDIPLPWPQIAFTCQGAIYSAKLDGSLLTRLTFSPTPVSSPFILPDGLMIFSAPSAFMAANLDGTDYSLYLPAARPRSPTVTPNRQLVFIDAQNQLAAVHLDRPLHSRRALSTQGPFHSVSALPDGRLLVTRPSGLALLNPATGAIANLLARPNTTLTQARLAVPRPQPDGRGSVVDPAVPSAKLYALNIHTTDQPALIRSAARVRILHNPANPATLGETTLEPDGSFHLEVPPNQPLKIQLLNAAGAALRTSAWIWVRNKENRGCIGCHEDPELSPDNRETQALIKPAVSFLHGAKP